MAVFVGLDWGGASHAVCVIDATGKVVDQFQLGHDRDGLTALVVRLRRRAPPHETPIAIERPSGLLVDTLIEAGFVVTPSFHSENHLAAEAGVAPVTYASGKSRGVGWRWACNKRLRAGVTCFADNSRHASQWAADVYQRARNRGCNHAHAVRILARAWITILWRAWQDCTPYDPARHPAARALLAAQHA